MNKESHFKALEELKVLEFGSLKPDLVPHCPLVRCNHLFGHLKARCEEDKCFPGVISATESLTLCQLLAGAHPVPVPVGSMAVVSPNCCWTGRLQSPSLCPSSAGWSPWSSG